MARVVVVGAGVLGSSVAYHLARSGAQVTVVDSGSPLGRHAASGATFAWINANGKSPPAYFELNVAGMAAHGQLAAELDGGSWLHGGGSLAWAADEAGSAALAASVRSMSSAGYPCRQVSAAEVARMEPALVALPQDAAVVSFDSEAWVDTSRFCEAMLAGARDAGAEVRTGAGVVELDRGSATLTSGDTVVFDVLVDCAGRDAGTLAALAGLQLPVGGSPGLIVITAPGDVRLGRVLRPPGVQLRPDRDGCLALASTTADAALAEVVPAGWEGDGSPAVSADVEALARDVVERASVVVPALAGVQVQQARIGRRAIPADGQPIVGAIQGTEWMYHLVAHSGVTLAPLLGRLAAIEIVTGRQDPTLDPYRPSRFEAATEG